ncbi:MAG: VanZ family protein [Pirellulales bacterium]|jgi:VanZ family protein
MTVDLPVQSKRRLLVFTLLFVFVLYSVSLVVATHLPRVPQLVRGPGVDKWLHLVAYGCQSILAMSVLYFTNRLVLKNVVLLVAILATFGAIDELTQPMFSRQAELLDWVADCVGIVFGVCSGWLVIQIRQAIKARRKGRP